MSMKEINRTFILQADDGKEAEEVRTTSCDCVCTLRFMWNVFVVIIQNDCFAFTAILTNIHLWYFSLFLQWIQLIYALIDVRKVTPPSPCISLGGGFGSGRSDKIFSLAEEDDECEDDEDEEDEEE